MVGAQQAIETTLATGANTPLSHCHAWLGATQYSVQLANTHTQCTLNWMARDRQAVREAGKERGRMEDGRKGRVGEGGSKGRE